ncbi:MAG: HU family DNA-binding protein [Phycisphaeraceae bacterium]|nr:HU family DNA-binding protein [Phycisphaeraceae bacterium]
MAKKMMKKAAKASSNGKSAAKKPGRVAPASKVRTLGDLCRTISEHVGVKAKEVKGVFETLGAVMAADLTKGPGVFKVGNLMKVTVVRKPATKEREGTNPFTGEKMVFKAKPARNVVKVRPLKSLKAMV